MTLRRKSKCIKQLRKNPFKKQLRGNHRTKGLFWPVLVLIPTILLVLILGAAMGTIVGFNNKLKGFENRINLLEESIMLKLDLNEKLWVVYRNRLPKKALVKMNAQHV